MARQSQNLKQEKQKAVQRSVCQRPPAGFQETTNVLGRMADGLTVEKGLSQVARERRKQESQTPAEPVTANQASAITTQQSLREKQILQLEERRTKKGPVKATLTKEAAELERLRPRPKSKPVVKRPKSKLVKPAEPKKCSFLVKREHVNKLTN